ncbi:MJ0042 family finger-like domain-containing protein [Paracoccus halophilus]|uniref:MJ0042 family finger-like domain-containing protein n=1 Tax=Paracoccus halophilus TaxID=376733 RepID=A0A099F131_9RHOB|nr:zinc-ribbon domain-containing protein [Paracoccus halophilus]KGJ03877.1 hypothetical protein IT41_12255 [Paracoccus halophilus]SFA56374.1 MJ0042 family finger-like domain-containing protein [Paracoccus halophilus]
MRLTCPRCAAQYEISDAAIMAAGREVECSACGHVWHQPGPAKTAKTAIPDTPRHSPQDRPQDRPYDPDERPALNRPLNESVLSILREETARELGARRAAPPATGPTVDHIRAKKAPAAIYDHIPPRRVPPLGIHSETAPPPAADPSDSEWPATTVTAGAEGIPADPVTPAALPDATELAATLTRTGPPLPAGDAPALTEGPARAETVADAEPPPTSDRPAADAAPLATAAAIPAATPVRGGSGYMTGFGLAVMIALGVVALYALAPRVAADEEAGFLSVFRQELDRGRLWLHDRIIGEE